MAVIKNGETLAPLFLIYPSNGMRPSSITNPIHAKIVARLVDI